MSIGPAIRAAREAKGWSQPDLAERVDVARETVSRWETEALRVPTTTRIALETVLGVSLGKAESKSAGSTGRKLKR